MQTLLNPYEITKWMVSGEAYYEEVAFESLPGEAEDEINFGDCVIGSEKKISFIIRNNGNN